MSKNTFYILCFEGALLSFNVAASAALVPAISRDFSVAPFFAGRLFWLYMMPYGVAALVYGPLVRAFDAKKVELICFFLFSLANLLAGFSRNIATLFLARFLMGVFGASVIPLVLILIARHTHPENRGRQVGIFFSATFVASLLGLFLSGILPWRQIFFIPGFLGLILWLVIYIYLPSFKEDKGAFTVNYVAALKDKTVLSIFTYIFIISLIYHAVQQWLGVYFSMQLHFNQFLISTLITLTSLSGIFGEALGGRLADSMGRVKTIDLGILLMIVSLFALISKTSFLILALIMMIWGLGWTFNHAGLSTLLTDLPREFLNESASLNSSVRFIAGGLGTVGGGVVLGNSFNAGFLVLALSLVLLLIFAKGLLVLK